MTRRHWRLGIGALAALLLLSMSPAGSTTQAGAQPLRAAAVPGILGSGHSFILSGPEADAPPNGSLPAGYHLYTSKVLPYSIGYPPGWKAEGSVWGNLKTRVAGMYFEGDVFGLKSVGTIGVYAENLPAGSPLTSQGYAELWLLELQREQVADSGHRYTARRLGTLHVDGTTAYLINVTQGKGSDALEWTRASWVAHGKGWWISLGTVHVGAAHDAYVPVFKAMIQTFRRR